VVSYFLYRGLLCADRSWRAITGPVQGRPIAQSPTHRGSERLRTAAQTDGKQLVSADVL